MRRRLHRVCLLSACTRRVGARGLPSTNFLLLHWGWLLRIGPRVKLPRVYGPFLCTWQVCVLGLLVVPNHLPLHWCWAGRIGLRIGGQELCHIPL